LEIIKLGNESTRGGPLIDGLVGLAIKNIGAASLQNLTNKLDAESSRKTAQGLETLEAESESWRDVLQNENEWSRTSFPGLKNRLVAFFTSGSLKAAKAKAEHRFKEHQTKIRHLIINLAVRAYKLEKGQRPKNISDLVPDYLKAIPQDPFTGTNMTYLP
jgi:hypothetical protein